MKRRPARAVLPLLCAAALAACAAPQATAPPPAAGVPAPQAAAAEPPAPELPPQAEELETYPLVRDAPALAAATAALAAAPPDGRPALLMQRTREAVAAAQKIRTAFGNPIHLPGWAPDHERFLAYYDLAARDLTELLIAHPGAPEAAEATYTMGLIHDYPHLDLFEEALYGYRIAVERFPGTPWALKAAERIALIESFLHPAEGVRRHVDFETPTETAPGLQPPAGQPTQTAPPPPAAP